MSKNKKSKVIKAKPTDYHGVHFKSKLEAQWAVFLEHHHLCADWRYEPRSYEIPAKGWTYTPDFWVSVGGMEVFLEIKPVPITDKHAFFLMEFTRVIPQPLILCVGSFFKQEIPQMLWTNQGGRVESLSNNSLLPDCADVIKTVKGYRFDIEHTPGTQGTVSDLQDTISRWTSKQRLQNHKSTTQKKKRKKRKK